MKAREKASMATVVRSGGGAREISAKSITQSRSSRPRIVHIDGLRGLAIFLVVFFHVFVGRVSSGVDVFLFLGGLFLISSQMWNAANPKGLTLSQSIIRIARRLMPSLIAVSFVSAVYLMMTTKKVLWQSMFFDLSSAVGYWSNWRLIAKEQAYTTATGGATLFQHLWSMSVQLQVYLVIIVSIWAIFHILRNRVDRKSLQKIIVANIGVLSVLSLVYATYSMYWSSPEAGYYSTFTRFWEIGLGGIVGYYLPYLKIPHIWQRWALSIVGALSIVTVGLFINGVDHFPGPLTLIPLLGAACVVISGNGVKDYRASQVGPVVWFLTTPVMKFLGRISYNLYLWHWVVLIVAVDVFDIEDMHIAQGVAIIAVSLLFATIAHYVIERPLQQKEKPERDNVFTLAYLSKASVYASSRWYPAAATVVTLLTVLLIASPFLYRMYVTDSTNRLEREMQSANVASEYPGAVAALQNLDVEQKQIYPNVVDRDMMMPPTTSDGCFTGFAGTEIAQTKKDGSECAYGDTASRRTLYVVGGSHSEQFIPALHEIGKRYKIKIVPFIKMGCPMYQTTKRDVEEYPECSEQWSPAVEKFIMDNPPTDGVFMIGTRATTQWGSPPEMVPDFYVSFVERLSQAGIVTYLLRDNAWMTNSEGPFDPRECVFANSRDSDACAMPVEAYFSKDDISPSYYGHIPGVKLLDMTKAYVVGDKIRPVIGNILVYRDTHHLTKQFVETMTNELERQMVKNSWTSGTTNTLKESLVLEGNTDAQREARGANGEIIVPGVK